MEKQSNKKIILTGIRPTGVLHLGNYAGAISQLLNIQKNVDTNDDIFLMMADLHALTTLEDTKDVKENTLLIASLMMAIGIDPKRTTMFVQSHIPEHAELSILLGTVASKSLLELNPVYKEIREEHPKLNTIGLLNYPVLQAADILLYNTTHVPVGKDQLPHIEITREITRRFNTKFGTNLVEPKEIIQKESKILSLQNSSKKMSKSHSSDSYIGLLDSAYEIKKKISKAVTDSDKEIKYDPEEKPAVSNLLLIFSLTSKRSIQNLEKQYSNTGYAELKKDLTESIIEFLKPIQENYKNTDQNNVLEILKRGAEKAQITSSQTLSKTKKEIGLLL